MKVTNSQPSFGMALRVNTKGMTRNEILAIKGALPDLIEDTRFFDLKIGKWAEKDKYGTTVAGRYELFPSKANKSLLERFIYWINPKKESQRSMAINNMPDDWIKRALLGQVTETKNRYLKGPGGADAAALELKKAIDWQNKNLAKLEKA